MFRNLRRIIEELEREAVKALANQSLSQPKSRRWHGLWTLCIYLALTPIILYECFEKLLKFSWKHIATFRNFYGYATVMYIYVLNNSGRQLFDEGFYGCVTAIYVYVLNEKSRQLFDKGFASPVSPVVYTAVILFYCCWLVAAEVLFYLRNLPQTEDVTSLFIKTLKKSVPDRQNRINKYLRHVYLLRLLSLRNISVPLRRKSPSRSYIKNEIIKLLSDDERLVLEENLMKDKGDEFVFNTIFERVTTLLRETMLQNNFEDCGDYSTNLETIYKFRRSTSHRFVFCLHFLTFVLYCYSLRFWGLQYVKNFTDGISLFN